MLTYKHFIFDFDGTLSDSYPSFAKAAKIVADRYGVPSTEEQNYYLLKKYSTVHLFDTLAFGDNRDRAYAEFKTLYEELLRTEAVPLAGVFELLTYIREQGGKSYVYSHSGDVVMYNAKRWGIHGFFEDYMLGDKSFPRKPAPDALLVLLRRHDLDPRSCVMIGDRDIDVLAGANAGMDGILIDDENYYPDLPVTHRVQSLERVKDCL